LLDFKNIHKLEYQITCPLASVNEMVLSSRIKFIVVYGSYMVFLSRHHSLAPPEQPHQIVTQSFICEQWWHIYGKTAFLSISHRAFLSSSHRALPLVSLNTLGLTCCFIPLKSIYLRTFSLTVHTFVPCAN